VRVFEIHCSGSKKRPANMPGGQKYPPIGKRIRPPKIGPRAKWSRFRDSEEEQTDEQEDSRRLDAALKATIAPEALWNEATVEPS